MLNSSVRLLNMSSKVYSIQFDNCKCKLLISVHLGYLQNVNDSNATYCVLDCIAVQVLCNRHKNELNVTRCT